MSEKTTRVNVTIYPSELAVIDAYAAAEHRGNRSQAIIQAMKDAGIFKKYAQNGKSSS